MQQRYAKKDIQHRYETKIFNKYMQHRDAIEICITYMQYRCAIKIGDKIGDMTELGYDRRATR